MLAAIVVLVTGAGLSACTALPEAGSPQPFDVAVPNTVPLDLSADGPMAGSAPRALVRDFLLACAAGTSDEFATARRFLTSETAKTWHPETLIQVYATDSSPSYSGGTNGPAAGEPDQQSASGTSTTVTVTATAVATVDDTGILTRAAGEATIVRDFTLVLQDGEWRIDVLDDGVVLSESSFTSAYQDVDLYFPATTGDALVADPRWYPARRLATHLVTGLLGGPSQAIAAAVSSAVPEEATLPSQGVAITDRVARVELAAAVPTDKTAQRLLAWQMSATLTQASTVTAVDLSVSGTDIDVTDLPAGPEYVLDSAIGVATGGSATDTTEMGVGDLVLIAGSTITHRVVPAGQAGEDARDPAFSPVLDQTLAWLHGDGMSVSAPDGARIDIRVDGPTAPSVDRWGWAWTTASSAGGQIVAATAHGGSVTLDPPFSDSSTVEELRISPDGARAVVLRVSGGTRSVWIAPITRDASGGPRGLGEFAQVTGLSSDVADVSWAGRTTLVVLRPTSVGSGVEVVTVPLGGFLTALAAPSDAVSLTGGASPTNVYVTLSDHRILTRSGSVWQPVAAPVREIRYPG